LTLDQWLTQRLEKTKNAGLYRQLRIMHHGPRPQMLVNQKDVLVFSSNNYLGMANKKELIDAAKIALIEFGVGSSGSQLTTGHSYWHHKLENRITTFKKTESTLLFSSGYLANIGVLSTVPEEGDIILSDQLNHASIIDGCRLSKADTVIYKHVDMMDLENKLKRTSNYKRRFIITDGVFSMDGNIAPLDKIVALANRYDTFVIVDDAHATGVLGKNGRGTNEYFDVEPDIVIGTMSKAIGTEGGFVTGSKTSIDFLLNHARSFIFQTAIAPAICAASYTAINRIEEDKKQRSLLLKKIKTVKTTLTEMGYEVRGGETPIIPVLIGSAEKAVLFADKLYERGIYAPAIRPPSVPYGQSRIRLTITTEHTEENIKKLLLSFKEIGKELNII